METMPGELRRSLILEILAERGSLTVDSAVKQLGVSAMTVRRDFDELDRRGALRRIHGGAVQSPAPESFGRRRERNSQAKQTIARKAAKFLPPYGCIAIDASSTAGALAQHVTPGFNVLTNSLHNLQAFQSAGAIATLLGGMLDPRTDCFVGPVASATAARMTFDAFFLSAAGVHPTFGPSEVTADEAELKLVIARQATVRVLMVDTAKLGA